MYDYEYEWQVMGFLRMLKYAWQINRDVLKDLKECYRCDDVDLDDIGELSMILFEDYICTDYLPENADDYDEEYACYLLLEPTIDEYLRLHTKLEQQRFDSCRSTGVNKLRDAVELFIGASLYDFKVSPRRDGCVVVLWPSPDWFDFIELANAVIDLMTYIAAENRRMQAELTALTAPAQEMEVAA